MSTKTMTIEAKAALLTGANRGLGFPTDVREDGGELAHGCGQGARAPERGAPRSRARRGMSNRRGRHDPQHGQEHAGTAPHGLGPLMTTKRRENND
jgi:hypothetical protein